jgi:hypothetical protein
MVVDFEEYRRWIRMAMEVIVELPKHHRMPCWGLIEELYEQFDDNNGETPQNSISIPEIQMLVELGDFITCGPRVGRSEIVALAVTIGICTISIPLDTCGDSVLQEKIEVVVNGDLSGTTQQMSYGEISLNNRKPITTNSDTNRMRDLYQKTLLISHRSTETCSMMDHFQRKSRIATAPSSKVSMSDMQQ